MTKRSLNFESDNLYSSWQHGMELLAHVWGSEEANEGMSAFLEGRKPDFQKFRMRDKKELQRYVEGYERDENAPPDMRGSRATAISQATQSSVQRKVPAKAAQSSKRTAKR
jgi:naphthoate synthase